MLIVCSLHNFKELSKLLKELETSVISLKFFYKHLDNELYGGLNKNDIDVCINHIHDHICYVENITGSLNTLKHCLFNQNEFNPLDPLD